MTHDADCRALLPSQSHQNVSSVSQCQDEILRPQICAIGYECGRCGARFGTLRAFDNHRDDERKQR